MAKQELLNFVCFDIAELILSFNQESEEDVAKTMMLLQIYKNNMTDDQLLDYVLDLRKNMSDRAYTGKVMQIIARLKPR